MSPLAQQASWWPAQLSAHAAQVDLLLAAFTGFTALLGLPAIVLLVWFAIRYRKGSPADRSRRPRGNPWLEFSWMLGPFVAALGFYVWATWMYLDLNRPPDGALEIHVVAKQWMWKFQHPGGQREIDELHVPTGQPVKLVMISQDVIHSLYFPDLRIKRDVLPDRYTVEWFEAREPGDYRLQCAEFCGTDHASMGGVLHVMRPEAYAAWLELSGTDRSLAAQGEALFRRYGCSGCHGAASKVHAPSLAGVYGSPVPLSDGSVIVADERYVRDSILFPASQVAAGYAPIMPSFRNLLGEDDIVKLVAYIKSLAGRQEGRR